jgi:poly(A) polymerase
VTNLQIIPRAEHSISRKDISPQAVKVLYRLKDAGFAAYLVGGGVRDLLLGGHPKDFDVATDAHPDEVKKLFRNCRLIGRRFRLAHIHFGREIIEVATFRGHHDQAEGEHESRIENGMLVRDNVYGTLEEDAWRRDFTINALYYNIADFSVVDYTGGLQDLKARTLRMIGDPEVRFQEDPVRMLRAIRFAAKLDFRLAEELAELIPKQAHLLDAISSARLFDEVLKLFLSGHAEKTFALLHQFGLFRYLFAQTADCFRGEAGFAERFVTQAMHNTDARIQIHKPVNPAFLYAAILWPAVQWQYQQLQKGGMAAIPALAQAGREVLDEQISQTSIPKRFRIPMKEIWQMQLRMPHRECRRSMRLLESPRFRAGYDFMLLRHQSGEDDNLAELCEWWTEIQTRDEEGRLAMCRAFKPTASSKKRRRRRKKAKKA